jgi:hypothetical protein
MQVEFRRALPTYDELPRAQWIFKYSCQNTIVVSRTFFTQVRARRSWDRGAGDCSGPPCTGGGG